MVLKTKNRSRRASTNQRSEVSDVQRSNVSNNNRLKFRLQLPHERSNTRNFQVQSRVFIILDLVVPRYTSVRLVYTQCTPVVLVVVVVVDLVLLLALPLPVLDLSTGILQVVLQY